MTSEFLARSQRMCALNQGLEPACALGPCGRRTDGAAADRGGRNVGAYREAGLTWWVEALGWWRCDPAGAMARIRQGPSLLN